MNLTYYPYRPFKIAENGITILDVGTSKMFVDLYRGFTDHIDSFSISDDKFETKTCASQCKWYGDILFSIDLNKLFIKKVQLQIIKYLSEEQQILLLDSGRQLISQVLDGSFMMDLPIETRRTLAVEDILKFANLTFPNNLNDDPYAIIETLIQIHAELNEKKCIVVANVSHYITKEQISKLDILAKRLRVTLLIIEFSEFSRSDKFVDEWYYYIDKDFNDIRDFT